MSHEVAALEGVDMITINKTLAVTAAVIAAGLVAAVDFAQSRSPSAAAVVAARFPTPAEMLLELPGAEDAIIKSDKDGACTREHWPYIADECLTSAQGTKGRPPVRTITIERRVASNVSELVRMPVAEVASR